MQKPGHVFAVKSVKVMIIFVVKSVIMITIFVVKNVNLLSNNFIPMLQMNTNVSNAKYNDCRKEKDIFSVDTQ